MLKICGFLNAHVYQSSSTLVTYVNPNSLENKLSPNYLFKSSCNAFAVPTCHIAENLASIISKNSRFFFVKVKKIAGSLWPLVSSSSSQYPSLHCNLHLGAVPSKTRMYQKKYMASESGHKLQGVSKKRYLSDFLSYFKITKNNQK